MNGNSFNDDVHAAQRALERAKIKSGWIRLLTLGLLDGRAGERDAEAVLNVSVDQLRRYESLRVRAAELDDELLQTIDFAGVRLSKNTFADLPAFGHADYPRDWEALRLQVLARDGYCCTEACSHCDGPLQIHHRQPLSRGGSNSLHNLVTLCLYHHCTKHPHMMAKYYGNLRG